MRSRRTSRARAVRPEDMAFVRAEAIRLSGMSAEEMEWEGLRWRWGLVGESRSRIFLGFAASMRRARCQRLGDLGEDTVWAAACRINWL